MEKSGGDNSMLSKEDKFITRINKRSFKVNSIGIKLDCLKVRNMPAPSSRMSYREYRTLEKFEKKGSPLNQRFYFSAKVIITQNSERPSLHVKLAHLRNYNTH
jgi:hypothetical protein